MYLGVIMICGLPPIDPTIVGGCLPVSSQVLYLDKESCTDSLNNGIFIVGQSLPEGAYISSAECFALSESS